MHLEGGGGGGGGVAAAAGLGGVYASHLQRSIDSLRSLGDRLGERNVDLRLNLQQHPSDLRAPSSAERFGLVERDYLISAQNRSSSGGGGGHHHHHHQEQHRGPGGGGLPNFADRLMGGGGGGGGVGGVAPVGAAALSFERERLGLMSAHNVISARNGNSNGIGTLDNVRNGAGILTDRSNNAERLRSGLVEIRNEHHHQLNGGGDARHHQGGGGGGGGGAASMANELKFRDYKAHLDNLRNAESSRSIDVKNDDQQQQQQEQQQHRGTPSSPSTPLSVGEGFPEEKVFGSKAELQLHTQAHMREAKPYKCSQCCKAFANSSYLSQHTRIHLGIKPYRCEICQRKFTQLSHLQQHIRTHTGDKPYKCRHPGCQKAFSQLSNLQSHSRCHQTDKPYKCNSCYKCFSDEPSLLEHIPKHKESKHLKTHICQYCGKSYTQETYLQKHMQKHAERTDKRPPIGHTLGLNHRGLDHPYWPKVSPDSAENMHDYPGDIPRQILEQNEDLVIIRQQLGQNHPPAPPSTPNAAANLSNSYDTSITKSNANSAFTPISSMSGHLNHLNHQLAPNRPYLYDAISFQKQNSLDGLNKGQTSNGFPNQLISLHQIRNYAHQPNPSSLMEHSILGGLKDK